MIITIETTLIIMTQVMKIIMIISVINSKSKPRNLPRNFKALTFSSELIELYKICRRGGKSNPCFQRSAFSGLNLDRELSGMDSVRALRKGVLLHLYVFQIFVSVTLSTRNDVFHLFDCFFFINTVYFYGYLQF